MASIKGINKTSLWNTWKILRKDLRNASIRDVIDFVDYDVDPDKWIERRYRNGDGPGKKREGGMPSI